MAKIRLKQVDGIGRKKVSDAYAAFMRHCQVKNLAPHTITYYHDNVKFFLDSMQKIKFVDEITQEHVENFIGSLMDKGNRVNSINARLRAAYVVSPAQVPVFKRAHDQRQLLCSEAKKTAI